MSGYHVLYVTDENYLLPTAISICSLLENNKALAGLIVHVAADKISHERLEMLRQFVQGYGREINFLDMTQLAVQLEQQGVLKWNNGYTTYLKSFAAAQIAETGATRALHIDSDTIVTGDISRIFDVDLKGYACGMAYDMPHRRLLEYYGLTQQYYNAGVILFHLDVWCETNICGMFLEKLADAAFAKRLIYTDQDLMNLTLRGRVLTLPPECNFTPTYQMFGKLFYEKRFGCFPKPDGWFYTQEELRAAQENPIIFHYLDIYTGRPWDKNNSNPATAAYRNYQAILGWPDDARLAENKRQGMRKFAKNAILFWMRILPSTLSTYIAFVVGKRWNERLVREHKHTAV